MGRKPWLILPLLWATLMLTVIVPWRAPFMTGGELALVDQQSSLTGLPDHGEWLPLARLLRSGLPALQSLAEPFSPARPRLISGALLCLLAGLVFLLAQSLKASRLLALWAAALFLLSPLSLPASVRLETRLLLLGSLLLCASFLCHLKAARGQLWFLLPGLFLAAAALLTHPATLGFPLLLTGLLLLDREVSTPKACLFALPGLTLSLAWPFLRFLLAGKPGLAGLFAGGGRGPVALPPGAYPELLLGAAALGLMGSLGSPRPVWGRSLFCLSLLAMGAFLPYWLLWNPALEGRCLVCGGWFLPAAPGCALFLVSPGYWKPRDKEPLRKTGLVLLNLLALLSFFLSTVLLRGLAAGAVFRQDILAAAKTRAKALPSGGQLFLLVPSGGRSPGQGLLDALGADLAPLLRARTGHILRLAGPLQTLNPSPGLLHGLDFRPGRDAVLGYEKGEEAQAGAPRNLLPAIQDRMAPHRRAFPGALEFLWDLRDGFQEFSLELASAESPFSPPAYLGQDSAGLVRYRLSKERPSAFCLPLPKEASRGRLERLAIEGWAPGARQAGRSMGRVVFTGAHGEQGAGIPFSLPGTRGVVEISLPGKARNKENALRLLIIPAGRGQEVRLLSIRLLVQL